MTLRRGVETERTKVAKSSKYLYISKKGAVFLQHTQQGSKSFLCVGNFYFFAVQNIFGQRKSKGAKSEEKGKRRGSVVLHK